MMRRSLFIGLFLIIALCIALWALWVNRNLVMEQALRRALAARGYDAAFSIDTVTDTYARLDNISVKHEGKVFFEAKNFEATYIWPDVKSGVFKTIALDGAAINLELDERFTPISAWLPESSGESGGSFPSDGVTLTRSKITLTTPYGIIPLSGGASIPNIAQQEINFDIDGAQLSYDGDSVALSGHIDLNRDGDSLRVTQSQLNVATGTIDGIDTRGAVLLMDGTVILPLLGRTAFEYTGTASLAAQSLSDKVMQARNFSSEFEGDLSYEPEAKRLNFDAQTGLTADSFVNETVSTQRLQLDYAGRAEYEFGSGVLPATQGRLAFDGDGLGLQQAAQRQDLARKIALDKTLSTTPIAAQFHDSFTQLVDAAFQGSRVAVTANVTSGGEGYAVSLEQPVQIKASGSRAITLTQGSDAVLSFDAQTQSLALNTSLLLSGERTMRVSNLRLTGPAKAGGLWSGFTRVRARVSSEETWQNETSRLAPFDAVIDYSKSKGGEAALKVTGGIDYDGPLMGYAVERLNTKGALNLNLKRGASTIAYTTDTVLRADKLQTPLGWDAENLSLRLIGDGPLMSRAASGVREIDLKIADVTADMTEADGARDLQITAEAAHISGTLGGAQEGWDIALTQSLITSANTPVADTRIKTADLRANVKRTVSAGAAGPWRYELETPAIDANIKPLRLRSMALALAGSGGDFTADYSGGTVNLDGQSLPNMPMAGQAVYKDGALSGASETALPRAPNFPVYINYEYSDGRGSAELDVPNFVFRDGGVQPQDLAPVLKGKVAAVEGRASATVSLGFISGQPLTSKGTVTLEDMNIGTLVGPFEGVTTTLNFDSLLPLKSAGTQNITMSGFNPGLPLGEGALSFDVIEGGINIHSAEWPLGDGRIWLEPTIWRTGGAVNQVIVSVSNIDLGDLISRLGNTDMSATGTIEGSLPITVDGVDVRVVNGRLAIQQGGIIRVRTAGLDAAAERNETAKIAIDALKEFEYQSLSLDVNGPLDGDILLGSVFTGSNPDVLGGAEFLFRVNIEGELVNIAKSFANNAKVEEFVRMLETGAP